MPYTNAHSNAILNAQLGSGATLLSATQELGLSSTEPNAGGGNITEPVGGAYARLSIANNDTNWTPANNGAKANNTIFTFPEATADWGTVSHWVLFDLGTPKLWGILDNGVGVPTPVEVLTGKIFRFLLYALRIKVS